MAYKKQTFVDNQTIITASIFKHIEDGIVNNENALLTGEVSYEDKAPAMYVRIMARNSVAASAALDASFGNNLIITNGGEVTWEQGAVDCQFGIDANMTNRIRTGFIPVYDTVTFTVSAGTTIEFCPIYFDANKNFVYSPNAYQTETLTVNSSEQIAVNPTWTVGAINTSTGADEDTMTTRLRSHYIVVDKQITFSVLDDTIEFCPVYYTWNESTKKYVFKSSPSAYQKTDLVVTPDDCKFLRIMVRNSTATGATLTADYGKNLAGVIEQLDPSEDSDIVTKKIFYTAEEVDTKLSHIGATTWTGKTLIYTGDSIPHGQSYAGDIPIPYPEIVAADLGMTLKNYAIGGSTIAYPESIGGCFSSKDAFDAATKDTTKMYIVVTGQTYTNYSYNGSSWVTTTNTSRTPLSARYSFMDDGDLVMVHAGTNDFQYNWTDIGTMEDRTDNTFYGALHNLCLGLLTKYFGKTIIFCTPIKRAQDPYTAVTSQNDKSKTLKDYCNIIKEVCEYYSIPVIDLYAISGLNPHLSIQSSLFDSVKTHPLQDGHTMMGHIVASQIKSIKQF